MSVSQAAMNGLSALMSLGTKAKPIERDSDSFKTAMADASIQHTSSKPRPERTSSTSRPAEQKGERIDRSNANDKPVSSSERVDAGSESKLEPVAEADDSLPLDKNDTQMDLKEEAAPEPAPNLNLSVDGSQVTQTMGSFALAPHAADAHDSLLRGMSDAIGLSTGIDDKGLSTMAGRLQSESPILGHYFTGEAANGGLNTTGSLLDPLPAVTLNQPLAPGALQMAPTVQSLKASGGLFSRDGQGDAEGSTGLGLTTELDADGKPKSQLTLAANDKNLLSPSQKVLTATAMQLDPGLLKVAPPNEQKANLLSAVPEAISSINSASAPTTNALNNRMQPLTVPVNQPHWAQSAGERVVWMVSQKLQSAEIQLDPPELGPLQVKISVQHDQVSITFVSHSAQVREALDQHAVRLREMFEGQGLDLVDVDVSDQSFQQREEASEKDKYPGNQREDGDTVADTSSMITKVSSQLVDHFV